MAANRKFDALLGKAASNGENRKQEIAETAQQSSVEKQDEKKTTEEVKTVVKKETRGRKKRVGVDDSKRPSAERGCKIGYERHGFVLPSVMIEQVKNLAKRFGQTESAIAESLLQKGIDEAIAKHGESCVKGVKVKSVF